MTWASLTLGGLALSQGELVEDGALFAGLQDWPVGDFIECALAALAPLQHRIDPTGAVARGGRLMHTHLTQSDSAVIRKS